MFCKLTVGHRPLSIGNTPPHHLSADAFHALTQYVYTALQKAQRVRGALRSKCQHIFLTCCSIFVNIVNHGLTDGNVNCTCESNKTSRLITFTNADYDSGTA